MTKVNDISGIADDSTPSVGRIYDYLLGGNHNFEIDRAYAEKLMGTVPFAPKLARLVRWFLGEAVRRLLEDGITQFVDFASGLPVQDHIHQIAPKGARVVYSDHDAVTVAYAKEIIGADPNVAYILCDVREPETLLNSSVTEKLLDRTKKTAFGLNGITYFLSDEACAHTFKTLYDWAGKGDRLYLCESEWDEEKPGAKKIFELYSKIGQATFAHSKEKMAALADRWKPIEPRFASLEEWIEISNTPISIQEEEAALVGGSMYGVIFEK